MTTTSSSTPVGGDSTADGPRLAAAAPETRETPHAAPRGAPSPWALLAVLLIGQAMALLDVSIVNIALGAVGRDLRASGAELQLVVGGYTVVYGMLLITCARLGAMFGVRRMFTLGTALFTLSSLACGLAPTAEILVGARLFQGAGAAMMMPQVMSVIQVYFTGAARAKALSVYAAVLAVGGVAGLVLGGVLVDADLFGTGWRSVFLVNVPLGVAVLVLLPRVLAAERRLPGRRLDLRGLAVSLPAVLLLMVPLVLGQEAGWPAWAFAGLAAGAVLTGGFVALERRVAADGGDPLLDLRVLRYPGLATGLLTLALGICAYGGYLFALTIHLQLGLGNSALATGLTFAPAAVTFGIVSFTWRRLPERSHPWLTPVGLTIAAAGFVAAAVHLGGGRDPDAILLLVFAVAGVGFGLMLSPLLMHALVNVPPASAPDASGMFTTVLQLGQVVGVAVFGAVFFALTGDGGRPASAHAIDRTLLLMALLMAAAVVTAGLLTRTVLAARRSLRQPD
jgi:predicted MFS family arabinose efflux permease